MREIPLETNPGRIRILSYREFIQIALGPSPLAPSARASRKDEHGWAGASWETAQAKAMGDTETALRLRQNMVRQANKIMGHMPRLDPVYRPDGGLWIDVSRYLAEEPEVWGDLQDAGQHRRGRRATVVLSAGANAFVDVRQYEQVTQMISGTLLGLKMSGVAISLYVCYKNEGIGDMDITALSLTDGSVFNLAQLAAITRTWFFRRLVFSYWETRDATFRGAHSIERDSGYGCSTRMSLDEARLVSGVQNPVLFDISSGGWQADAVQQAILASLQTAEKKS